MAAEVRNRAVNLPRALILGTIGITAIYLAVNAAYLLVPYLLWVSYATYLNAGYWWLNR